MTNTIPQKINAVLFDMDGVLYDSMKHHAATWIEAFKSYNINFPLEEAYLNEGSTGDFTIKKAIKQLCHREATPEEIEGIYEEKTRLMHLRPKADKIPGMQALMKKIRDAGRRIIVVTGSKQPILLERLQEDFGVHPDEVVSGYDVKHGKPHPEPYLMGLSKAGVPADQAIVIENAPLGIESALAAGIHTIAINTGPLEKQVLFDAGAREVFDKAKEVDEFFEKLL
ncbi:HAD family phosphatase [Marinilabilia salmonicolor]|jgi:HAD superfamily hydrolase (TIGR01509 family)|uniref:HAD superfamily hydrolase (TIGR01509 family) n=1 Tax=Marinilabilia salmonicolor TaxID=989 RepID=A0A368V4B6_9BACT|nr:HAD family phosphatase [Marinilabilia salmonicolor]RCW34534.1 HAD superfamily hydrolase (TIGR01509 family) [Marinilabilia salmonicolor]